MGYIPLALIISRGKCCAFLKFIGWDVVRHVKIGKFNLGRKLQFVVSDLQFFDIEKGSGPNVPSSPPRIAVFVED